MHKEIEMIKLKINHIPAILYGKASDRVFLHVHGQCGCKEDAETFAEIAVFRGWQVLSIDLPEHGERTGESIPGMAKEVDRFNPWTVVPELRMVMEHMKSRWEKWALAASSIGAWFCMQAFAEETFEKCLLISPMVDMKHMISNMMLWAGVSEERLENEGVIATEFGQPLSWEYYVYVKEHPILLWDAPTEILYGENDTLMGYQIVQGFARQFSCGLTVMEKGEHWFHTPQQLMFLQKWVESLL